MGCCLSKRPQETGTGDRGDARGGGTGGYTKPASDERNRLSRKKDKREETWQRTGIVALRDSDLKELPKAALALGPVARNIDATNNRLEALPPEIGQLNALQRLVVSRNQLRGVPADLGLLVQLKLLSLDNNMLTSLPPEIGQLHKLEKLHLHNNGLKSLPSEIGHLTSLRELNLGKNKLEILPSALGQCVALELIDAKANVIMEIPHEIGELKRLKELLLDENGIREVPSSVFLGCVKLQTLSLHKNPINVAVLQKVDGYSTFVERVKQKHDKQIDGGVLLGSRGLDDGLDHETTRIVVPHT
ncbi:leucine-rich repeat-containing protein [Cymbomonas tetramitiformis]|uniref:Leucine-rich repeat-containing protein n=1 Tax=Cymbomonas tetramitiformis TaxID=36881 RepID=A0AAE0C9Y5_9CHLO|nr:leucine-rich repeat-containing protein [Cymbomonas tetramitiformis]